MAATLLFHNARLFDGLTDQPRSNVPLVVTGDRITSVAARDLCQNDNIGSIAPGRYADFLVIDGDPLRDVRELRKLITVYRGGVAYDPQALLAQVPKSDFVPLS